MSAEEVAEVKMVAAADAVDAPAAEAPAEPKPAEEPNEGEAKKAKAPKEKKPKAPKEKKPKPPTPSHPPYFQMIEEAILALDDNTGSSPYAIAKYMEEKHKEELPLNYKKVLAVQLRNFTARGKLVKVKASFKLSDSGTKADRKRENKRPSKRAPAATAGGEALKKAAAPKPSAAKGKRTIRPRLRSRSSQRPSSPLLRPRRLLLE